MRTGDEAIVRAGVAIASRKYPAFDEAAGYVWGVAALKRDDVAIFVTQNCFVVAVTYERFWAPGRKYADLVLLASGRDDRRSGGQLLALARAVKQWIAGLGCERLYADDALAGVDLGAFVRRIGAPRQYCGYVIEFPAKGR